MFKHHRRHTYADNVCRPAQIVDGIGLRRQRLCHRERAYTVDDVRTSSDTRFLRQSPAFSLSLTCYNAVDRISEMLFKWYTAARMCRKNGIILSYAGDGH